MNELVFKSERVFDFPKSFFELTGTKEPANGVEVITINGIQYSNVAEVFTDNFLVFLSTCYINDAKYIISVDGKYYASPVAIYILAKMIINNDIDKIFKNETPKNQQKTYIIKDYSSGLVKIGKSKDPYSRIKSVSANHPNFSLIFISGIDCENQIHQKLSPFRESGEWFLVPMLILNEIIADFNFKKA